MEKVKHQSGIPVSSLLAIVLSENKWRIPKKNLMQIMYNHSISLIDFGYKLNIKFKRLPSVGWWSSEINDEIQYWIQNRILDADDISFVIRNKKNLKFLKKVVSSFPESNKINGIINNKEK